ncbi:MAG: response regulator transcription factor [Lachnospiraceae bacterium]|nr:response regulator transcription factor [Lachnospiraceae bacterium]
MTDVLIIEDDEELRGLIADFLEAEGYKTAAAESAEDGLAFLEGEPVRIILLDLMLPGADGFTACTEIRERKDIPIIMMSARDDEESKLTGYRLGADDYIAKPLSVQLLTAKVKALLHRSEANSETRENLSCGSISVDTVKRQVYKNGLPLEIRGKLYDLLLYMIRNSGRLLLKDELYDAVWGDAFVEPSTLNVHIRWLRERIEDDTDDPRVIKTVWRKGYIFGEDD